MKPLVIGVTGYARHGKGEVAKVLVEEHGYTEMQFSGQLKAMALKLNPYVLVEESGEDFYLRLSRLIEMAGGSWDTVKRHSEVRRILQVLGTECVRDMIGRDSWVRALEVRLEDDGYVMGHGTDTTWLEFLKPIVVSDVRFPNEAKWIQDYGKLILVKRPEFENGVDPQHPSEKMVQTLLADHHISNNRGLEELRLTVRAYMLGFE